MVFKTIRRISAQKELKKVQQNPVSGIKFDQIHTIGIIYYADNEEDARLLKNALDNPFFKNKEVEVICWLKATKKQPHPEIEGITFVYKTDFTSQFLPGTEKTTSFAQYKFDLLLDLSKKYQFSLHALSFMSKAGFKTGLYNKHNKHLHFTLQPDDEQAADPGYTSTQIINYLKQLF